ncbi:MAG TPA: hypothetical protein VEC11_13465 [Allosphingosinicella sp.]|nr:hypothetical protein [Allosphingosinicella sp.]
MASRLFIGALASISLAASPVAAAQTMPAPTAAPLSIADRGQLDHHGGGYVIIGGLVLLFFLIAAVVALADSGSDAMPASP